MPPSLQEWIGPHLPKVTFWTVKLLSLFSFWLMQAFHLRKSTLIVQIGLDETVYVILTERWSTHKLRDSWRAR